MIDQWIWAVGAIVVGLLSGVVGAALVRLAILKGRENRVEALDAARATAIFVFLFFAAIGAVVAVGVTNRDTLRPIPARLLAYSPHVLAAGLILIAGRALAFAVAGYVKGALVESTTRMRGQLAESIRVVITIAAAVLSLRQLGIDTTILNIAIGAMLFGLAAAFALLVGLGGRELGRELATGRYLPRMMRVGDEINVADVEGTVVAMHPASIEVMLEDGTCVHIPNTQVFAEGPRIRSGGPNGPFPRSSKKKFTESRDF
jgi:Mechanosensitive ion channel